MVVKAADAAECWLRDGLDGAMRFNGPLRPDPGKPSMRGGAMPKPPSGGIGSPGV
jgi:hypothetical protein